MPRATPANGTSKRTLQSTVAEKAALQTLTGGNLEDVNRVRGARQHNLRNVDLTAPYMHNGYFSSLSAVVEFYNDRDVRRRCKSEASEAEAQKARCWPAPEVAANVNRDEMGRLRLTEREIDDIVAFMRTLTDGWDPAAARAN